MKDIKLFVYGTLKRGFGNYEWYMKNSKFLGEDTVKGRLFCGWSYPWLMKGNNNIHGEVFLMPQADFLKVAKMEIGAGYYVKTVKTGKGKTVKVFFCNRWKIDEMEKMFFEINNFTKANLLRAIKFLKQKEKGHNE